MEGPWDRRICTVILPYVFRHLPVRDLLAAGQTCRLWRGLSQSDALWQPHCVSVCPACTHVRATVAKTGGFKGLYMARCALACMAELPGPVIQYSDLSLFIEISYNDTVVHALVIPGESMTRCFYGLGYQKTLRETIQVRLPRALTNRRAGTDYPLDAFGSDTCPVLQDLHMHIYALRSDQGYPQLAPILPQSYPSRTGEFTKDKFELTWRECVQARVSLSRFLAPQCELIAEATMFGKPKLMNGVDYLCLNRVEVNFWRRGTESESLIDDPAMLLTCLEWLRWTARPPL